MVPRGEVGIVVAGLGLSQGAIGGEIYTVVVGMAILTTIVVPPLLPVLVRRAERADASPERDAPQDDLEADPGED